MTRRSLALAGAMALLIAACGRGAADKGQPTEQQRSDLDDAAKMVEGNQTFELPDDSLTVNESGADTALNSAVPRNAAVAPAPAPVPANGVAANSSTPPPR